MNRVAIALTISLATVMPAFGQTSTALPAPSALTLLSLGIAGLMIGRHAASRRNRDED